MSRILFTSLLLAFLVSFSPLASAAPNDWKITYGDKDHQVKFYNSLINPQIQEAAAFGPMAFRILHNQLWLADSIGGRLLVYAQDGTPVGKVDLIGHPENTLIEDFAFRFNKSGHLIGVWIADGADGVIRLFSYPEGRELAKCGGVGDEAGLFKQIHQLETDVYDRLYVGDYGKNTITLFDAQGRCLREMPWSGSGFALDAKGNLSTITFSERIGHSWVKFSPDGQILNSVHLGMPRHTNPRLWFHDAHDGIYVSFIPETGFRGLLHVFRFSPTGAQIGRFSIRPPQAMNRFLENPDGKTFYLALADFERAPRGRLLIRNLSDRGTP